MGDLTNVLETSPPENDDQTRSAQKRKAKIHWRFCLTGGGSHLCKHAEGGWKINHSQPRCNAVNVFHPAIQIRRARCLQSLAHDDWTITQAHLTISNEVHGKSSICKRCEQPRFRALKLANRRQSTVSSPLFLTRCCWKRWCRCRRKRRCETPCDFLCCRRTCCSQAHSLLLSLMWTTTCKQMRFHHQRMASQYQYHKPNSSFTPRYTWRNVKQHRTS